MGDFNKHANTNTFYMIFDFFWGLVAYLVSALICGIDKTFENPDCFAIALCSVILVVLSNANKKLYTLTLFFYIDRVLSYLSRSVLFATVLVWSLSYGVGHCEAEPKFYVIFVVAEFLLMFGNAFLCRFLLHKLHAYSQRTLFVGSEESYATVINFLKRNSMGFVPIGYLCESDTVPEGDTTNYLGTFGEMERIIHENAVDQVFIQQNYNKYGNRQQLIELCMKLGVTVRELQLPYKIGHAQNYICSIGTYPMITYHNVSMNAYTRTAKRFFDVLLSIIGIVLSSPIMLVTAIAIKLDSKGPVIFCQERVGKNGRHFKMFKFRSMCADAEAKKKELAAQNKVKGGLMFKIDDDPRITRVGKFIRKTSIDELPQFFNVLIGDMSLVGTRPPTVEEVAGYDTKHWRRLSIKPGITGMWQVNGRSTITDFDRVVSLDKQYIDNWSLWLDVKIMFKTALQLFSRKKGAV